MPPQTYTMPCGALPDFVSILLNEINRQWTCDLCIRHKILSRNYKKSLHAFKTNVLVYMYFIYEKSKLLKSIYKNKAYYIRRNLGNHTIPSVSTVRHVAPVVMSAFVTMGTGQGQTHGQNEGNTQHGLHGYWKTKEITSLLRSTLVWVCNQGNDPGSRSITRSERGQRTCWTSWLLKHKGKCITTPCDTWICVCNQGNDPGSRSGTLPERTELISWLLEEKTMKITLP